MKLLTKILLYYNDLNIYAKHKNKLWINKFSYDHKKLKIHVNICNQIIEHIIVTYIILVFK